MLNKKKQSILNSLYEKLGVVDFSSKNIANFNGSLVLTKLESFDDILGGIPYGRTLELFGNEGAGKTGLAMYIAAAFQKDGARVHWIDAEQQFEPKYAINAGLKLSQAEHFYFSQENIMDVVLQSIYDISELVSNIGQKSLWVIDTIASCPTQAELEKQAGQRTVASQAGMMSMEMRKMVKFLHSTKTTVIFINQVRDNVGVLYGNPEKTPVGKAVKFYVSQRIRVSQGAKIKKSDKIIGHMMKIKIIKNRIIPPFQTCAIPLIYGIGFEPDYKKIEECVKKKGSGIIYKNGYYVYGDKEYDYLQLKRMLKVKKII